ncbi:hypothetical protein B9G53_14945 [Pseudanabaena sp. SR411]|uniref:hypothetical protein n=1 Tax=Pseudanabaena sp. SR411 TaxID=1980935 RepID=UPI000B997722|nr:hypothetical protein [Pseudanabaena sp. SR411]OYQ63820.1 hypothetical protein B9G53_14945 [Pseudanabaena sp. SR411]
MINVFKVSPLIRITLLLLYIALTAPLPFLSNFTHANIPASWLSIGLVIGFVFLYGALNDRVILDDQGISLVYPQWFPKFFRRGWSLSWQDIKALKPRITGQGGLVYYFVSKDSEQAYLLPMRVVGFTQLVKQVEERTGIDTRDVRPLAQPWMYLILLVFTLLLLLMDSWTIYTALTLQRFALS